MEPIDLSLSQSSNVTNLSSKSPWPEWYLKYVSDLRETYTKFEVLSSYHIFADNALALLITEPELGKKIITAKLMEESERNPSQAVMDLHNQSLIARFPIFIEHASVSVENASEYLRQSSEDFNQLKVNLTKERHISNFKLFIIFLVRKMMGRLDWFEGIQIAISKDRIEYIRNYCGLCQTPP